MAHAVSALYSKFNRMSPVAAAMALALHGAVGALLFWESPLRAEAAEHAIEFTVEVPPPPPEPQSEPPAPEAPPAQVAAPAPTPPPSAQPSPPIRLGLAPPRSLTPDPRARPAAPDPGPAPIAPNPAPQPAQAEPPAKQEVAKEEPPKQEPPKQEPAKEEPPKEEPQQQVAAAAPPPPAPPPLEQALPPLDAPPPPIAATDFPKTEPAPAPELPKPTPPAPPVAKPQTPPPPQQRAQTPPPPQQHLQPSPLAGGQQRRPPADSQAAAQPAPSPFTNPAGQYGQRKAEEDYLWRVAQKASQHQQFVRNATTESGSVVMRLTIARDGTLIDVSMFKSSGLATLDATALSMIRQASPFPPFPADITGARHTFLLPLQFRRN